MSKTVQLTFNQIMNTFDILDDESVSTLKLIKKYIDDEEEIFECQYEFYEDTDREHNIGVKWTVDFTVDNERYWSCDEKTTTLTIVRNIEYNGSSVYAYHMKELPEDDSDDECDDESDDET